jgi:hypothetical protein
MSSIGSPGEGIPSVGESNPSSSIQSKIHFPDHLKFGKSSGVTLVGTTLLEDKAKVAELKKSYEKFFNLISEHLPNVEGSVDLFQLETGILKIKDPDGKIIYYDLPSLLFDLEDGPFDSINAIYRQICNLQTGREYPDGLKKNFSEQFKRTNEKFPPKPEIKGDFFNNILANYKNAEPGNPPQTWSVDEMVENLKDYGITGIDEKKIHKAKVFYEKFQSKDSSKRSLQILGLLLNEGQFETFERKFVEKGMEEYTSWSLLKKAFNTETMSSFFDRFDLFYESRRASKFYEDTLREWVNQARSFSIDAKVQQDALNFYANYSYAFAPPEWKEDSRLNLLLFGNTGLEWCNDADLLKKLNRTRLDPAEKRALLQDLDSIMGSDFRSKISYESRDDLLACIIKEQDLKTETPNMQEMQSSVDYCLGKIDQHNLREQIITATEKSIKDFKKTLVDCSFDEFCKAFELNLNPEDLLKKPVGYNRYGGYLVLKQQTQQNIERQLLEGQASAPQPTLIELYEKLHDQTAISWETIEKAYGLDISAVPEAILSDYDKLQLTSFNGLTRDHFIIETTVQKKSENDRDEIILNRIDITQKSSNVLYSYLYKYYDGNFLENFSKLTRIALEKGGESNLSSFIIWYKMMEYLDRLADMWNPKISDERNQEKLEKEISRFCDINNYKRNRSGEVGNVNEPTNKTVDAKASYFASIYSSKFDEVNTGLFINFNQTCEGLGIEQENRDDALRYCFKKMADTSAKIDVNQLLRNFKSENLPQ